MINVDFPQAMNLHPNALEIVFQVGLLWVQLWLHACEQIEICHVNFENDTSLEPLRFGQ